MKVLVCGDRYWGMKKQLMPDGKEDWIVNPVDIQYLNNHLDEIHKMKKISLVIEGEAHGADLLSRIWAEDHGIDVKPFPANWKKFGKSAGPIRNRQMLIEGKPDLVVAFHRKIMESRGTKNMLKQAKDANIPTIHYDGKTSLYSLDAFKLIEGLE